IPITMRHVFAGEKFEKLVSSMVATLKAPKGRIIFSGCGATGRLSILLESMWRDFFHRRAAELTPQERKLADRSASIMTGGDFALIKSVESFEDSMAGGERQAAALNIGEGDTFVAITEGGETSSVLGTLRYASRHGAKCFLVFNNPAYLLRDRLDRCREAIDNPQGTVLDISGGSMSVAGSTRMQATSSEQLLGSCALEAALCRVMPRFAKETAGDYTVAFERLLNSLESPSSRENIAGAIDFECALYAKNGRVTYFADDCMLDLFTDTTERSPTFMLPPFRSTDEGALAQSWAFVKNPLHGTEACWNALFHRDVRCLEWNHGDYQAPGMPKLKNGELPKIGRRYLMKYPIGNEDTAARYAGCESAAVIVRAGKADSAFEAAARAQAAKFGTIRLFTVASAAPSPLEVWKHLAVKLTFNNLSTGTRVKMGRVSGNWMSWVSISNKKLIDRGIRLISELGRIPYAEAAERLFDAEERIESQDWTGKETPCAVQVALEKIRKLSAR
ncbi:MAG: sugar phosphate isomerase, partial [Kiritimatiellae bacterium]|nr:sugar phosphate isomerase [Kiritimatiellia bacterium]